MIDSKELALKAAKFLDEKGANDIVILDVGHMTSITDYFVIANGRNVQAVHTLAEDLEEKLAEHAAQIEANLNAKKDAFFAEFEAAHSDDIASIEAALAAKKQELKATISGEAE